MARDRLAAMRVRPDPPSLGFPPSHHGLTFASPPSPSRDRLLSSKVATANRPHLRRCLLRAANPAATRPNLLNNNPTPRPDRNNSSPSCPTAAGPRAARRPGARGRMIPEEGGTAGMRERTRMGEGRVTRCSRRPTVVEAGHRTLIRS